MAGYSATPLWKKLGLKPGLEAVAEGRPGDYIALLALPDDVRVTWAPKLSCETQLVHVFETKLSKLSARLAKLRKAVRPNCAIWVSWPKKTSKVETDITEDRIRDVALPLGFVDIKVCAVSEIWSGLKLVIRKDQR